MTSRRPLPAEQGLEGESARSVALAGVPTTVDDAPAHAAFWDLVDAGTWEPATLEALNTLTDGSVYIDVGAWIGPTVLTAARKASQIIAYEPDPVAARYLRRNIALNGLDNVDVREVALLDREGALALGPGMLSELGASVSSLVYGPRAVEVAVRDGRREAASDEFRRCDVLKVDVEGAEYRLIRRLAPYLRARRPTLLLSVHGVQWRMTSARFVPRPLAVQYRQMRSALERAVLFRRLRHYEFVYIDADNAWRPLSATDRATVIRSMNEHDLLFSSSPYPPP